MMKKPSFLLFVLGIACIAILSSIIVLRLHRFEPKRRSEEQVIAYKDCSNVELFFHNPADSAPVEIRVEVYIGDGPYDVARTQVQPGETVTLLETIDGEPFHYFVSGVFGGRILVYDLESGKLKERIEPLEFRIYQSYKDDYDALTPFDEDEREIILDDEEYRPDYLKMRVDLKKEELRSGFYGLVSEWRELDSYVYAVLDGEKILIAKAERLPPRSITFELYLEPGVADMLTVGETVANIRVDSYYSDTGEYYDSIPAEICEIVRTD